MNANDDGRVSIHHAHTRANLRAGAAFAVLSFAAIALAVLLAGCAQYDRQMACRASAGRQPYGGMGGVIAVADPEWQAWNRRVATCVRRMATR